MPEFFGSSATQVSGGLLALVVLMLAGSVLLNLFFSYRYARQKKKPLSKQQIIDTLKHFLRDQLVNTQNAPRHKRRSFMDKKILRIRSAYLAVEERAINQGIDSDGYWHFLNEKLQQLLTIFDEHKSAILLKDIRYKAKKINGLLKKTPDSNGKKAVVGALVKLQGACEKVKDNPERLAQLDTKLSKILLKFENEDFLDAAHLSASSNRYLKRSGSPISNIHAHASEISQVSSQNRNHENASVRESMASIGDSADHMKVSVNNLQEQLAETRRQLDAHTSMISRAADNSQMAAIGGELRDVSDEIIEASEREIKRLKELVQDKKLKIRELEEALHGQDKAVAGEAQAVDVDAPLAEELALVRRNLMESEQCIVVLENELEQLRQERALSPREAGSEGSMTESTLSHLNDTIGTLRTDLEASEAQVGQQSKVLDFIRDCIGAGTAEDVSLSVYQCLQDMGLEGNLLVYTKSRTLEINAAGAVPNREKILINNMQVGEVNLGNRNTRIHFRFRNLGGNLHKSDGQAFTSREKATSLELLEMTDKILMRINQLGAQQLQKKSLDVIANSVKYLTNEIDESFNTTFKQAESIIRDGFAQVQDLGRISGLSASQLASIKNLEKTALEDLAGDTRNKLRLRKAMLNLLQKIETIENG